MLLDVLAGVLDARRTNAKNNRTQRCCDHGGDEKKVIPSQRPLDERSDVKSEERAKPC